MTELTDWRRRLSVVRFLGQRRGSMVLWITSGIAYLFLYLNVIGDFWIQSSGFGLQVVENPLGRMFRSRGLYRFEPIAVLELGEIFWLVSPLDILLGGVVGGLVGLNVVLTWLAFRYPEACGFRRGTGILAGIPALLGGSACCGPVILLVIGLQATGLVALAFNWLIPAALILLIGAAYLAAGRVHIEQIEANAT